MRSAIALCFVLIAPCAGASRAVAVEALADEPLRASVAELDLAIEFPSSFSAAPVSIEGMPQIAAAWRGKHGKSTWRLHARRLPHAQFRLDEPAQIVSMLRDNRRRDAPGFDFDARETVRGPFGLVPHAILLRESLQEEGSTRSVGAEYSLCAVVLHDAYVLELSVEPAPDPATHDAMRELLTKGVRWNGKPRDARWSDPEVFERWQRDVPDPKKTRLDKDKILRTEHYVILTNASGGKSFGEKMEECYDTIRGVFPFEEGPDERLMPVFLFRTPDEYHAFFAKQFGATLEEARRSKGVASGDFYATWYEAPNDPVHIHEATHQIFRNRLRLSGGGSWFQEGVAEYICTRPNDRNVAARTVKRDRQPRLAEFMQIQSLLFSATTDSKSGADEASTHYDLAGFLIEFLRESDFSKARFQEWLHAVGSTRANDVETIEAHTRRILGVDLAGLEKRWTEYAARR